MEINPPDIPYWPHRVTVTEQPCLLLEACAVKQSEGESWTGHVIRHAKPRFCWGRSSLSTITTITNPTIYHSSPTKAQRRGGEIVTIPFKQLHRQDTSKKCIVLICLPNEAGQIIKNSDFSGNDPIHSINPNHKILGLHWTTTTKHLQDLYEKRNTILLKNIQNKELE